MKKSSLTFAHQGLRKVNAYEPGKPVEEVERELKIRGASKMASNENAWGPSPKAVRALKGSLAGLNRYPDGGCFYLKKALAAKFKLPPGRIVLGNGSDELIVLAIRAFVPPGSEVLTATPTFLIYRIAAQVCGARPVEIPMRDFRYDLEAMARAVNSRTRAVFIANPDNPVGTYVTHRELGRFIRRVPERCLIFIDEAYYEYAAKKPGFPRSFAFLKYPNVILSRTFSKAYGLSGLRAGYAFSSPQVADGLNKVREPFNVNLAAQTAALAALKDGAYVRAVVKKTGEGRAWIEKRLKGLGISTVPSATNFILMRVGPKAGRIYRSLMRRGVIVRRMKAWGLDDYLRVTVGRPAENRRFMAELKTILRNRR